MAIRPQSLQQLASRRDWLQEHLDLVSEVSLCTTLVRSPEKDEAMRVVENSPEGIIDFGIDESLLDDEPAETVSDKDDGTVLSSYLWSVRIRISTCG